MSETGGRGRVNQQRLDVFAVRGTIAISFWPIPSGDFLKILLKFRELKVFVGENYNTGRITFVVSSCLFSPPHGRPAGRRSPPPYHSLHNRRTSTTNFRRYADFVSVVSSGAASVFKSFLLWGEGTGVMIAGAGGRRRGCCTGAVTAVRNRHTSPRRRSPAAIASTRSPQSPVDRRASL